MLRIVNRLQLFQYLKREIAAPVLFPVMLQVMVMKCATMRDLESKAIPPPLQIQITSKQNLPVDLVLNLIYAHGSRRILV